MSVGEVVAAIRAGEVVVLPTDTVYGLAATALDPAGRDALYRLKGRVETQPTALLAPSVDVLLDFVPELHGRFERVLHGLLPGPYTLVLPNPACRFGWLCGSTPEAIGVRVPALASEVGDVLDAVGAVVATSANLPGGPEPRRLVDVPGELLAGASAVVDGGELPGTPSTVLDLTRGEPQVLRDGAGSVAAALDVLGAL
jgi:L-threonylcarbamoyladenylate synthase